MRKVSFRFLVMKKTLTCHQVVPHRVGFLQLLYEVRDWHVIEDQ
jgi:hypothetical protein